MPRLGQEDINFEIAATANPRFADMNSDTPDAPPLDVCEICKDEDFDDSYTIEHPPYSGEKRCIMCGVQLFEDIDG